MVICLLGIFAHVIRKSLKTETSEVNPNQFTVNSDSSDEELFRPRMNSSQSPIFPKEGFPLLNDSDSEEYIEMHRNRAKSGDSDDYYLNDNRTWTSVKDRQLDTENQTNLNLSD